ncbi:MAG: alpha/beta hydrolase family protein [Pseudooceanicola sp.]
MGGLIARAAAILLAATPLRADVALRHIPTDAPCPPLLLLSHGFGGSERAFGNLAKDTAKLGYDTWVMGHDLSGNGSFRAINNAPNRRKALIDAISEPAMHDERAEDIGTALDIILASRACAPPFKVLGGHSIGAHTTLVEAGAKDRFGTQGHNRFDAYVAMSPQGEGPLFAPDSWGDITKPLVIVTGTRDGGVAGAWRWRLGVFDGLADNGLNWFAVVDGANHMQVGGNGPSPEAARVRKIVVDFLGGVMSGDMGLKPRAGVDIRHR